MRAWEQAYAKAYERATVARAHGAQGHGHARGHHH
jgi:hypothetical protein